MPIFTIHQKIKNPRKVLIYRDFLCFTILSSGETGTSIGQDSLRIHSSRQDVSFKIFTFCITRETDHIDKNRIILDLKDITYKMISVNISFIANAL